MIKLESKAPQGPLAEKWSKHKAAIKVVSPANKTKTRHHRHRHRPGRRFGRRFARRVGIQRQGILHPAIRRVARIRIAAQGGINAAKNYQNDNDSVFRLFYDTIKGGDYRAREANVYRHGRSVELASSTSASAQGVPFAREYGGTAGRTVRSAVRRYRVRSMPAARPDSSCCWAPMPRSTRQIAAGTGQELSPPRDARAS